MKTNETLLEALQIKHDAFIREMYRIGAVNMRFSLNRDVLVIRCAEEPFDLKVEGFNRYSIAEIIIPDDVQIEITPHASCEPAEMEANCRAFVVRNRLR